ncbi:Hsp70 protein that interacts with Zuo1p [Ascosphaera aggregata]|nr:Hsp70 protein that interacts with Zuo1p [Ascosphaera aggregata]
MGASETQERCAIGITIGNSNSSIAHTGVEGKAEAIANEEGDRHIPSILSYVDGEEYHGTQAKAQLIRNSTNTVAYFRDFLGKDFKSIDVTNCHASAHPQAQDATVAFSIRDAVKEQPNLVSVSEIMTRHLRRLKQSASDFLGKDVNAAVVTVPTNFSEEQSAALSAAAKEAGIEVLQFISEPVAALLAYDSKLDSQVTDKIVVVADFGGTRSDVAVIAARGGLYTVLATVHDYELGGAQLDQILIDHFAKEFIKKHKTDPRENPRSLAKLKMESEATKKALSIGTNAAFSVESLVDGIDYRSNINRTRYELLAGKIFTAFTRLLEDAVKKAGFDILDVDEVICSGGTSHTPKVARLIQNLFADATVHAPATSPAAINPSDVTARGAAIQASLIEEFDKEDIEQSAHPMVTVTPHLSHAVGVELVSENAEVVFKPLLAAETALPARRSAQYTVKEAGDVIIRVSEGKSEIKVTKPEPKKDSKEKADGDEDDDDDFDSDEDEEEEIREVVWKPTKALAELAVHGVKANAKVEVMININEHLAMQITAREIGSKSGVRGVIEGAKERSA